MKKKLLLTIICMTILVLFGLTACNQTRNIQSISIKRNDIVMKPIDKETLNKVETILSHVKWSPGTKVEMTRKEDIQMEVVYKKNVEKISTSYLIWYSGKSAELVSSDPDESYGTLNEKHSKQLREITGLDATNSLLPEYKPSADDVVDTHGKVTNMKRFLEFLDHIKKGEFDEVRVVTYTEEGDPILHKLIYNGEEIKSEIDTRRDQFGNKELSATICSSIEKNESEYKLIGCKNPNHSTILRVGE